MKVGLVHGRFQPFHNGHKLLVDKMLEECDLGVVLIGSVGKNDSKNLFDFNTRKKMIRKLYPNTKKLLIGGNIDLENPLSADAQWDVVFSSCVLSLTGLLPTHVYVGSDYSVPWRKAKPNLRKVDRYKSISATQIRELMSKKDFDLISELVPEKIFQIIKSEIRQPK